MSRVLILGGTVEARLLAERIGPRAIYSLAGRTRTPRLPSCEVRVGPFGGADGLRDYLHAHDVEAVIDATHPFADQMPLHARDACAAANVPRLRLLRPAWTPQAGDRWLTVSDVAAAADACAEADRVFLAIGIQELAAFARLDETLFLVRTVEEPDRPLPLALYKHVAGRGPFDESDERDLLARHQIDTVVCKNSGGSGADAKLAAARALGLTVIMITRPPQPEGPVTADVDAAVEWLARL